MSPIVPDGLHFPDAFPIFIIQEEATPKYKPAPVYDTQIGSQIQTTDFLDMSFLSGITLQICQVAKNKLTPPFIRDLRQFL